MIIFEILWYIGCKITIIFEPALLFWIAIGAPILAYIIIIMLNIKPKPVPSQSQTTGTTESPPGAS